jgi:hypothetical protein
MSHGTRGMIARRFRATAAGAKVGGQGVGKAVLGGLGVGSLGLWGLGA